jgi:hypothetical protein
MKGLWIESDVLARGDLTPLAKMIFAMVQNYAKGGGGLHLPMAQLAQILGTTVAAVRSALYELQCARLIRANESAWVLATVDADEGREVRRIRLPERVVVLAMSERGLLLEVEGVNGVVQDEEFSRRLAAWVEQVSQSKV